MKSKQHRIPSSKILILITLTTLALLGLFISDNFVSNDNLEKFYSLTKNDPLLYNEYTNVTVLENSVSRLIALDDKIVDMNAGLGNSEDYFPEGWRLWPDKFLEKLVSVHHATENFLEEASGQNAKILLVNYENAVSEYKKSITLNITAMENILNTNPELADDKIIFLGSATTPHIILADFKLILANAKRLEDEVRIRRNCLVTGKCPAVDIKTPREEEAVDVEFKPLSKDILGIGKNEKVYGPYFAQTACFGRNSQNKVFSYPFYFSENISKKKRINFKIMMTNTKYYQDFTKAPNRDFASLYLKRGITVKPHFETYDYACTDLRYIPEIIIHYLKDKGAVNEISSENMLATLPYLIQHTLSFSGSLSDYLKNTRKPLNPLYLLSTRTAYSLYFGTFTKSIWRLNNSPDFLLKQDFSELIPQTGFLEYEDLLKKGFSTKKIAELNSLPKVSEVYEEEYENN